MNRRVVFSASAVKDLRRLGKPLAKRIIDKVEALAAGEEIALTPLKYIPEGLRPLYKYRVGDYGCCCGSRATTLSWTLLPTAPRFTKS